MSTLTYAFLNIISIIYLFRNYCLRKGKTGGATPPVFLAESEKPNKK